MQENIENNTKIIDRLIQFVEYQGDNFNKLAIKIGVSNSYFSKMVRNKGSIGTDIIQKIVLEYDGLNVDWLLTGRGSMFNSAKESAKESIKKEPISSYSSDFLILIREKDKEIKEMAEEIGKLKEQLAALKKESKPAIYRNVAEP